MMGYTHEAIGAGGAVAALLLASSGTATPAAFLIAAVAGTIGGIIVDADVVDDKDRGITDGSRSRLAAIGILIVGVILDCALNLGIFSDIIFHQAASIVGVFSLIALSLIAHFIGIFVGHRTFSHSLWFIILATICVCFICPMATAYFFIGAILHLLFDLLNYQVPNKNGSWHGVWLLYPIKIGEGIALRKCKAAGKGNKIIYFVGMIIYAVLSIYYLVLMKDAKMAVVPLVIFFSSAAFFHFVRVKSEREILNKGY